MGTFVNNSLIKDETIIREGYMSWWSQFGMLLVGVVLTPVLFGLGFIGYAVFKIKTTELAITNKKIVGKVGFFSQQSIELPLNKIESVDIIQTLPGKMFNYADVIIVGSGGSNLKLSAILDAYEFRKNVLEAIDIYAK